jgi:protein involved in polysaccharide export with SLBB domain
MRNMVAGAAAFVGAALLIVAAGRPALAQENQNQGQNPNQGGVIAVGGSDNIDPNQPIRVGFTLGVRVESAVGPEPDLTGSFQVDPSGSIQMKLAGSIQVRGLTPIQAADKIAVALKPYIKDPKVQVSILAVPKPVVTLGGLAGSVTKPGATIVNDTTTLAELLTIVGTGDNADLTRVRVSHQGEKSKEYNLLRWLKPAPGVEPDESQNPVLKDRDMVYVPPKVISPAGNVTVEGAVAKPGLVPVREGGVPLTLREAVSQAGGPTASAERRQINIRRVGVERPIVVNYDKMEAGDPAHNITLQTDDIVYVETLPKNNYITLGQAFIRPGKIPYTEPILLSQAIEEAGGPTIGAKTKEGRVIRYPVPGDPTKVQVIAFNWQKLRNNKQSDLLLEPGDVVDIEQGNPPRQALTPLELTQSLLSIALIVDRLVSGNRGYGGF